MTKRKEKSIEIEKREKRLARFLFHLLLGALLGSQIFVSAFAAVLDTQLVAGLALAAYH